MKKKFDVGDHNLVPVHEKLTDKEKEEFLNRYNALVIDIPQISKKDPAIQHLNPKKGDVIRILHKSPNAGETVFYRGVYDD